MEEEVESIVNKQQQQEKDHMEIEQMNMEEKCEEHMEEKCKDEMEEGEQCGEQQCEEMEECGDESQKSYYRDLVHFHDDGSYAQLLWIYLLRLN